MLSLFFRLHTNYTLICQDEQRKAKTVYFGVRSIITTILAGAFFTLGIWGFILLFNAMDSQSLSILAIVPLIIILAIVELVLFAQYVLGGLIGVIYQLRCNRRAIGWVALGLFIVVTVGMAIGIVFIISTTNQI